MTHPPHTYGQNKKAKAPKTLAKNFKKRATEIYAPKKRSATKAALKDATKRSTTTAKADWKKSEGIHQTRI
jgi:hypothetical protein